MNDPRWAQDRCQHRGDHEEGPGERGQGHIEDCLEKARDHCSNTANASSLGPANAGVAIANDDNNRSAPVDRIFAPSLIMATASYPSVDPETLDEMAGNFSGVLLIEKMTAKAR